MNCHDYQALLRLNRPGERTESEDRLLAAHLEACAGCRREKDLLERVDTGLEFLRGAVPEIREPEKLADSIMERLGPSPAPWPRFRFGWNSRRVRQAGLRTAGAVAVLAVLAFCFQAFQVLHDVRALEERTSRVRDLPVRTGVAFVVPEKELARFPGVDSLRRAPLDVRAVNGGYIVGKSELRLLRKRLDAWLTIGRGSRGARPEFSRLPSAIDRLPVSRSFILTLERQGA